MGGRVGVAVVSDWALRRSYVAFVSRLLVGAMVLLPDTAPAHIDFSSGKSPEQLFASNCSGCHRSPQALAHGRDVHALTNFLREHYTTKEQSAALLSAYITRPTPSQPVLRSAENSFLKTVRTIWRKVSASLSWLTGPLARLFRA